MPAALSSTTVGSEHSANEHGDTSMRARAARAPSRLSASLSVCKAGVRTKLDDHRAHAACSRTHLSPPPSARRTRVVKQMHGHGKSRERGGGCCIDRNGARREQSSGDATTLLSCCCTMRSRAPRQTRELCDEQGQRRMTFGSHITPWCSARVGILKGSFNQRARTSCAVVPGDT